MKPETFYIEASWRWGTPEGSREFDRLLDRSLTFREKLEWLEEAETLTLRLRENRERAGRGVLGSEECAALLECSRLQPEPTTDDEGAVENAVRDVRAARR